MIFAVPPAGDWYVYRYWIDDRIYYVVRVDLGGMGKPTRWGFCTGWLRTDGEAFGGDFRVWRRWVDWKMPAAQFYEVRRVYIR